jgi:hypothetical protein
MISEVFYEYVSNCFHPWLIQNSIKLPVILFIDGHKSHVSLEVANLCRNNQIILCCLYPNATHILQPCDVAIFKPLKTSWRKVILEYKQKHHKYYITTLLKGLLLPFLKRPWIYVAPVKQ